MEGLEEFDCIACTNNACKTDSKHPALHNAVNTKDPSLEEIGDPANLNQYLLNSGATQHMAPCKEDLFGAVEGQNLVLYQKYDLTIFGSTKMPRQQPFSREILADNTRDG
jgi:hypothetical protein